MLNPVDWLQVFAIIGVGVTIIGGIVGFFSWVTRRVRNFESQINIFMRDWQGEEAAPGRDAVPGVMERLNKIDGELKHNGGSTIKDSVARIEESQKKILSRLAEGTERFEVLEERITNVEKKVV